MNLEEIYFYEWNQNSTETQNKNIIELNWPWILWEEINEMKCMKKILKAVIQNMWNITLLWGKLGHAPGSESTDTVLGGAIIGRKNEITEIGNALWVRCPHPHFPHPSHPSYSFHLTINFPSLLYRSYTMCSEGIWFMEKPKNFM